MIASLTSRPGLMGEEGDDKESGVDCLYSAEPAAGTKGRIPVGNAAQWESGHVREARQYPYLRAPQATRTRLNPAVPADVFIPQLAVILRKAWRTDALCP